MFLNVAGGRPFGEFGRVVFVGVLDDGSQDVQRNGGLVRGVLQSAGGSGLRFPRRAFGGEGAFKRGDVRVEGGDEIGGEAGADELRLKRGGVGGKSAGGIEQGLIAVVVRHEEFSSQPFGAKQHEGMDGVGDANHVVVQMEASGDFGKDGAVGLFAAGNLRGSERGGHRHGGMDEGELLSAQAGRREVGGVFDAKGVNGFECGYEAADFLFHFFDDWMISMRRLSAC